MEKIRGNEKAVFNRELVGVLGALRVLVSELTSHILWESGGSKDLLDTFSELKMRELAEVLEDPKNRINTILPMQKLRIDWLLNICNSAGIAAIYLSEDGMFRNMNEIFRERLGYDDGEFSWHRIDLLYADTAEYEKSVDSMRQGLTELGSFTEENRFRRKDGSVFWGKLWMGNVQQDHPESGTICTIRDVSERKDLEQRIQEQKSIHDSPEFQDPVTDLYNGNFLRQYMEKTIEELHGTSKQLALVYIDLDKFKIINEVDRDTGDELLYEVGQRLEATLRSSDLLTKLGRSGGDEFLIAGSISGPQHGDMLARRLLDAIRDAPFRIMKDGKEQVYHITPSIGISIYPSDGKDYKELLNHAEIAMYRSKDRWGDCVTSYDPEMWATVSQSLELERDILKALDNKEFELHYQPQVSIETKKAVGAEALIRWNHPVRWLLMPNSFMPFAERREKLMKRIGKWVFEATCRQSAEWSSKGMNWKLAVNFSTIQFRAGVVEEVREVLQSTWANPQLITIEVTEWALEDVEGTKEILTGLKNLGLSISIDDFGTGYSCLAHLMDLPIDMVKLDKKFVDRLWEKRGLKMAKAIIEMAHTLKMKVIAEGVEHDWQEEVLKGADCDEIQGYFFSRPISKDELETFMKKPLSGN